jgi:biopolymer transport protein ExbD
MSIRGKTEYNMSGTRQVRISLTPLIDVVFILLLFFMLTSSFNRFNQLQITASQGVASSPASTTNTAQVIVNESGRLSINGQTFSSDDKILRDTLLEMANEGDTVIVRARADTSMQTFVTALDQLNSVGISKLKIAQSVQQSQ